MLEIFIFSHSSRFFFSFALSSVSFVLVIYFLRQVAKAGIFHEPTRRPCSNCRMRRVALIHSLHPVFHLAPFNVDLKINFAALRAIFPRRIFLVSVAKTSETLDDRRLWGRILPIKYSR